MTNKRDYAPITYACNGATIDFPFSWKILEKESVVVTLIGEGVETTLALGEDYNIDFDEVGGNVKTKTAYATGNSIIVARNASMYQSKTFSTSSGFQASEVEKAFDEVSINLQDMAYNIENFKENFSSEIDTKIEVYREDAEKQIEANKQEILDIQSDFEDEVNTKIQQVSDAATKINKLEEAVNTAITAATTASEKADSAAKEVTNAKTEVNNAKEEVAKAAEQAQIATAKAEEAKQTIKSALTEIENKTQTEINKIKQTGFYMQGDKLYYINSEGSPQEFNQDEQLATKLDLDAVNLNTAGKSYVAGLSFPSTTKSVDVNLLASGSTYTAPANGWFVICGHFNNAGGVLGMLNTTNLLVAQDKANASDFSCLVSLKANKGDDVVIRYNINPLLSTAGGTPYFKFIYTKGDE